MNTTTNLLPFDGEVYLYPDFLTGINETFYDELFTAINWKQEGMKMYGKYINFPRLTAWYGDEGKVYTYSGLVNIPTPFTGLLLAIKQEVEVKTGHVFNAALLNLYRDGQDSMGWHSDNEPELGKQPIIASLSFGAERVMQFKHKEQPKTLQKLLLSNNSLLLMKGETQHYWQHQIPKMPALSLPRINITFRKII